MENKGKKRRKVGVTERVTWWRVKVTAVRTNNIRDEIISGLLNKPVTRQPRR